MKTLENVLEDLEIEAAELLDLHGELVEEVSNFIIKEANDPDSMLVEYLLTEGKSFESCINYISKLVFRRVTKDATVRPKGNFAVRKVDKEDVFGMAVEYYESDELEVKFNPMDEMPKPVHKPKPTTTKSSKKTDKKADTVSFPSLFDLAKPKDDKEPVIEGHDEGDEDEDEDDTDDVAMEEDENEEIPKTTKSPQSKVVSIVEDDETDNEFMPATTKSTSSKGKGKGSSKKQSISGQISLFAG